MWRCKLKILNLFILLLTGVALIGVNVTKLHCTHCEEAHVRVEAFAPDCECPCTGDCECQEEGTCDEGACRVPESHAFYKVTETFETERELGVYPVLFELFVIRSEYYLFIPVVESSREFYYYQDLPGIPLSEEFLCTYLC